MSDNKIWFSTNITRQSVLRALTTLLALEFTGAIIGLKFVNFFRICKDLGIEVKDKSNRDQETAKNACADKLVEAGVGFTAPITEKFTNFKVKIFDNGGIVVTGTHKAYPGGFFEWSPFHSFVKVETGSNTEGFVKVGFVDHKGSKIDWKSTTAQKNQKVLPGLPGSDKDPNRYVKIKSDGFIFFIDTAWSNGKVFLDRKAYQALIRKGKTTTPTSKTTITATPTAGLSAEENDED